MDLRILPGNIANMIAAGEVVQRPASVVKELVENAADAGASQITVLITDSGRTLIQVIDDGCGMTPDDAVLCFERHATSKIYDAEDLNKIMTFGFRGEALASIAAVAEVTLKTRTADEGIGCQVEFAASEHISTIEAATPKGTNILVRNLFYNVPARRKFLKSDNVEFRHIVEEFTKVALTRPEIAFTLMHNGKNIYVIGKAKSPKFRIMDLLGQNVVGDIVDVSAETSVVKLSGFVGRPDSAKKTLGNQFLFVNGRYFRSPYFHKAVMKAYEGLIPEGVTPSYFIFLEVDPHSVDVNISPTKTEVKFEDDTFIFQVILAAIKETIGKNSFAGGIDFSNPESNDMPVLGQHFNEYKPDTAPQMPFDPSYNPFEPMPAGNAKPMQSWHNEHAADSDAWHGKPSDYVDRRQDYGKLFEDKTVPTTQILILQGKYILTQVNDGIMVVNIRRACEKIIYERMLSALKKNKHVTQISMFPVKVEVGVASRSLFDEKSELLTSLGFDITPFGTDTIVVNGVPEGFSSEAGKVEKMISDLTMMLADESLSLSGTLESSIAEKFAILGATNENAVTSPIEARQIVDSLLSCSSPELTSKGRKTMAIINTTQVDKLF
ncbi:MAG: DNA mismatch repair endonuclease MutL [Bacteroidales bacterium]|nr:DNA mismatch repair endonuclease MutL [Bacteroidales bacterium]MDY6002335.1 DNA mismatch repair endonuclease MutL [Candidatus Cryptobacteroides sp.]